jgi:tetratricopeptide (TPR) repeat protein
MSQSMQKPCRPFIPLALAAGVCLIPLYVFAADVDTSLKRPEISSRKMYVPDAYRANEAYNAPTDTSANNQENVSIETIRPKKSPSSNATTNTSAPHDTSALSAPLDASSSEPYSAENSAQWRARYADQVRKKIAQKLAGQKDRAPKAAKEMTAIADVKPKIVTIASEAEHAPDTSEAASTVKDLSALHISNDTPAPTPSLQPTATAESISKNVAPAAPAPLPKNIPFAMEQSEYIEPTHPEAPQIADLAATTTPQTAPSPQEVRKEKTAALAPSDASLSQVLSQVKEVAATTPTTPSAPVVTAAATPTQQPVAALQSPVPMIADSHAITEGSLAPSAGSSPQSPTPPILPLATTATPASPAATTHVNPLLNSPFASQGSSLASAQPVQHAPATPAIIAPSATTATTNTATTAPVTPSNAPLNPELADLSLAARGILESLPSDLTGLKQRKDPWKDVTIARQNPDIKIPDAKDKHAGKTGTKNASRRSYDANYELERAYQSLIAGDTESAVGIYQDVLSNEPNNETALFGLATTWQRLGNLDKAAPLYGQLLMQNPHNVEVLNNFLALVAEQSPQVALAQMERLAQRNPEFSPIFAQLALLYKRLNNFPKAIENMDKAIAVSPENLAYKYNLAILYDQANDKDNAIRVYRQLMRAHDMGQELPASIKSIQERLTFLASNTK